MKELSKIRKLQVGNQLRINSKVFKIIDISYEIEVIEFYLEEQVSKSEFMLQVPEVEDNIDKFLFYKVFRHGKDLRYQSIDFQKKVEII